TGPHDPHGSRRLSRGGEDPEGRRRQVARGQLGLVARGVASVHYAGPNRSRTTRPAAASAAATRFASACSGGTRMATWIAPLPWRASPMRSNQNAGLRSRGSTRSSSGVSPRGSYPGTARQNGITWAVTGAPVMLEPGSLRIGFADFGDRSEDARGTGCRRIRRSLTALEGRECFGFGHPEQAPTVAHTVHFFDSRTPAPPSSMRSEGPVNDKNGKRHRSPLTLSVRAAATRGGDAPAESPRRSPPR